MADAKFWLHVAGGTADVRGSGSVESAAAEVVGDYDVGDGVEHELDVGGVGGAGHVAVDLLVRRLVLRLELRLDVSRRFVVVLADLQTIFLLFQLVQSKSVITTVAYAKTYIGNNVTF